MLTKNNDNTFNVLEAIDSGQLKIAGRGEKHRVVKMSTSMGGYSNLAMKAEAT